MRQKNFTNVLLPHEKGVSLRAFRGAGIVYFKEQTLIVVLKVEEFRNRDQELDYYYIRSNPMVPNRTIDEICLDIRLVLDTTSILKVHVIFHPSDGLDANEKRYRHKRSMTM